MLANNGSTDGLFHGAFMQSGAPIPVGNYTRGQVKLFAPAHYASLIILEVLLQSNR